MTSFSGDFIRLEVADGVATIRLDRPPMNALNAQMQDELAAVAAAVSESTAIAAVVIYGGEKVFAAGADVKEMATMSHADMVERAPALQGAFTAIARIPKPVVAAVTGYALGGGCELAMAADFRICADDAKLGQPEILLGVIPGAGGTQRLPRLVGASKAKDLIFTGRMVSADEALAIGLVDRVVAPSLVYSSAHELAARFVGGPAVALRAAKAAIDRGLESDLDKGLEIERVAFGELFATEDQRVGMASFAEQGPGKAKFVGR